MIKLKKGLILVGAFFALLLVVTSGDDQLLKVKGGIEVVAGIGLACIIFLGAGCAIHSKYPG